MMARGLVPRAALLLCFLTLGCVAKPPENRPLAVAAAHPLAVAAGMNMLKQGGDAVDAAIAVQAMLGLVEPQSSGLGGGAVMLRYDAASAKITVYDGREMAPSGASAQMFLGANGKPLSRDAAMLSGRATGVPGAVAMLGLAHRNHGRLPWATAFGETVARADQGFTITPRLERHIQGNFAQASAPDVRAYFTKPDGGLMAVGDLLRNPAYAAFLRQLAAGGSEAFYRGAIAGAIVDRVAAEPLPGSLSLADLARYRPVVRDAICGPALRIKLCSAPPPFSGVGLLQLMALLDQTDIAARGPDDPQAWFLFAEASRLMYADRDQFVGDPAFTDVPVRGLLDPAYVASRRKLIGSRAGEAPKAGKPSGQRAAGLDATLEPAGTSHFIIHDGFGNMVAMTTTVEAYFGSGRMVMGFFLNNQMTDFSFLPEGANQVAPGKRPRSSMSPTLIFNDDGKLLGAVGSPGGSAIPAYVGKTLVGVLGWNLPMQQAINLPNLVARGAQFNGEASRFSPAVTKGLADRGIMVKSGSGEDSGLHGLIWRNGQWDGGADQRREGTVMTAAPAP